MTNFAGGTAHPAAAPVRLRPGYRGGLHAGVGEAAAVAGRFENRVGQCLGCLCLGLIGTQDETRKALAGQVWAMRCACWRARSAESWAQL